MEIKLTVRAEIIAVLKLFTSDKDVRYYLNGIALEIGATESRLVATNGSMLGCIRIVSEQPEVAAPLTNIIIPNDLLKSIKPSGMVEITIGDLETKDNGKGEQVPVSNSRPITLTYAGVSISGKTLDGVFPDFRRVIPSKVSGQPAQFDPRFIGTLAKAWSIIHGGKGLHLVGIGFNGTDAALIDLAYEDFTGVIMPLRSSAITAPVASPSWCTDSLRVATDSAEDLV
jgi:DNA polymerase-3 subunit beta